MRVKSSRHSSTEEHQACTLGVVGSSPADGSKEDKALQDLKNFLISREPDIAWDIEDFGELHGAFTLIFGRDPSK